MSGSPTPRILILGYGNPGRGDDALGPALISRLEPLAGEKSLSLGLELTLLTDFQLQVEHVLDLKDQDLVLLVDAHLSTSPPFAFERVAADPVPSFSTHWVSPGTLLKVAKDLQGKAPPTYLLGIRGYRYELGEPLSAEAQAHLEEAIARVLALLDHPTSTFWDTLLDPPWSVSAPADADSRSPSPTSILVQDP